MTPRDTIPDDGAPRLAAGLGRHWRAWTLGSVVVLALLGWAFLAAAIAFGGSAASMGPGMAVVAPLFDRIAALAPGWAAAGGGHGPLMPAMHAWGPFDVLLVFLMWAAMVFAMMLPTAAATFLAHARRGVRVGWVVAGYTGVWMGVAALATAGQAVLTAAGAMAPHMAPVGAAFSASVLVAAGIYQFTPLKLACLARCRNPHPAFAAGTGPAAAVRLGVEEGLACLGCCWALMAVMFAAGVMNLAAMAFLGMLMAAEKLAHGLLLTRALGAVLLALGALLAGGLVAA